MARLAVTFGAVLIDRHGQIERGSAHQPISRAHDLALGLGMGLALLGGKQALEFIGMCHHRLPHRVERSLALGDRRGGPARKRRARGGNGAVEIVLARIGDAADDLLGRGVAYVEACRCAFEGAADQHIMVAVEIHHLSPQGISTTLMHSPRACAAMASLIWSSGKVLISRSNGKRPAA